MGSRYFVLLLNDIGNVPGKQVDYLQADAFILIMLDMFPKARFNPSVFVYINITFNQEDYIIVHNLIYEF